MEIVAAFRYQQGPDPKDMPLTNFTFWVGAGFSKSWDLTAPTGVELFNLSSKLLEGFADSSVLSRVFGIDGRGATIGDIRQIVYQLDMYERYPDVCSRYVDHQNISIMRGALRAAVAERYDQVSPINYFDTETQKFPLGMQSEAKQRMLNFFDHLHRSSDGSQFFAEGVRCHFATTNYDFVIETILDNIVGPDDSLFLYTYHGFTPITTASQPSPVTTQNHWLTSHLLKLNGGFEILRSGDRYELDYAKRTQAAIIDRPPVLMLPSREQDYSDPYFRTIFPKAVRLMRETKVLILVGYSLPEDDALMRFILRQFAEEPEDGRDKIIFYVDPAPREQKIKRLEAVFPSISQLNVPKVATFEGGFADFAGECMSLVPRSQLLV
jgi:hypothetical protein